MTTTATRTHAHLPGAGCCHDDNPSNLPNCTKSQTGVASLESRAISQLTDDQAVATWERFKAVRKAYVGAVLEKVPA